MTSNQSKSAQRLLRSLSQQKTPTNVPVNSPKSENSSDSSLVVVHVV